MIRLTTLLLALVAVSTSGCIGIYDNTEIFLNPPATGASEAEVLEAFGTPAFATDVAGGGGKVYTYAVRNTQYIILVGLYKGYDLVVRFEGGKVVNTKKVPRGDGFVLFQPMPWAVVD